MVYLGGPLTFLSQLRASFDKILKTQGVCPENSLYYVALGASFCCDEETDLDAALEKIRTYSASGSFAFNAPLFRDQGEYDAFLRRHQSCTVPKGSIGDEPVYLGVDAGSTTVKVAVMDSQGALLDSRYLPNSGNPVPIVRQYMEELYQTHPDVRIAASAVTGYGEDIIKAAFDLDYGVVETVAHFTAARHFMPDVEFVIDIGGQDIKCFKIHKGAIDNIFLNEACSSGCGSFLQTFANALGYEIDRKSTRLNSSHDN